MCSLSKFSISLRFNSKRGIKLIKHKSSIKLMILTIVLGIIMTFVFFTFFISKPFKSFVAFIFALFAYSYAYYHYNKRKQGFGYYFDDEGVAIDLKETKVYWNEIEEIKLINLWGYKSTVIYPYINYHELIRERRGKKFPTPGHSIDWIAIEQPKIFHEQLLKAWNEWKENNSK